MCSVRFTQAARAELIEAQALGLILLWLATVPVRAQSPQRLTYIRFGGQITPNVPGSQLVQEARSDIYANNYTGAIPLLKEGVRLGNLDAMYFLSRCYIFGYGVPVDTEKARHLLVARARQQQANNRIVSARLQAEKNARIDRAMVQFLNEPKPVTGATNA